MARLTNWYVTKHYDGVIIFYGNVTGHAKLPDGMPIHTSKVIGAKKEFSELIIYTLNTEYRMYLGHIKFDGKYEFNEAIKNNKSNIRFLNKLHETVYFIYDLYCILNEEYKEKKDISNMDINKLINSYKKHFSKYSEDLKEWVEDIIKYKKKIEDSLKKRIELIKKRLENEEVYLDIGDNGEYYFNFMLIKDKLGEVHEIYTPFLHIGMFQDSVLITKHIKDEEYYDIRYFPYKNNRIEFYQQIYDMREDCEVGYIHNSGVKPIKFKTTWGKVFLLEPNEEKYIRYGITEGSISDSEEFQF